jgi:hypothetical protein
LTVSMEWSQQNQGLAPPTKLGGNFLRNPTHD